MLMSYFISKQLKFQHQRSMKFWSVFSKAYIAQIVRSIFFCYCSLDFEECAHKLLKMDFPESQTVSLDSYSFFFFISVIRK